MGFFSLFKEPANDVIDVDYDVIEAKAVQSNRVVATAPDQRQAAIKKSKVGDLVSFRKTKRDGNTTYVVSALNSGSDLGEISYGTSEWISEHYPDAQLLGRITSKVKGDAFSPPTVDIEYKIY